jgi:hypothetical protein
MPIETTAIKNITYDKANKQPNGMREVNVV